MRKEINLNLKRKHHRNERERVKRKMKKQIMKFFFIFHIGNKCLILV